MRGGRPGIATDPAERRRSDRIPALCENQRSPIGRNHLRDELEQRPLEARQPADSVDRRTDPDECRKVAGKPLRRGRRIGPSIDEHIFPANDERARGLRPVFRTDAAGFAIGDVGRQAEHEQRGADLNLIAILERLVVRRQSVDEGRSCGIQVADRDLTARQHHDALRRCDGGIGERERVAVVSAD